MTDAGRTAADPESLGVDPAGLQRGQVGIEAAGGHQRDVAVGVHAGVAQGDAQEQVGQAAGRADADGLALECLEVAGRGGDAVGGDQREDRLFLEQHDILGLDALVGHEQRGAHAAAAHVHRAGHHGALGFGAAGELGDLDVQSFALEVTAIARHEQHHGAGGGHDRDGGAADLLLCEGGHCTGR
jgi:hypothetical protein